MPRHRKYSGKMGRLGEIQLNCTDRWEGWVWYSWITLIDGKIRWNTDQYSTAFPHCDWLFFLWRGIKHLSRYWTPPKNDRRWFVLELVYLRGEKIISSHAHKKESWNSMRPKSKTISITDLSIWEFSLEVCLCCQTNEICFALRVRLVFRNVITCYHVKFIPKS